MPRPLKALILDVDGVLTETASLHEQAWKRLFDPLLKAHGDDRPFTHEDYLEHVDGKARQDGLRHFLVSRGIDLPKPEIERLAARKDAYFRETVQEAGVDPFEDALRALDGWAAAGLRLAAVSSSRNAGPVLARAGLRDRFEVLVDGVALAREGLSGKPAPDMFVAAAKRLGVAPARCGVLEDARSGVEAGRRGGFGLVVGVARHGEAEVLRAHGAHRVVTRLDELERRPTAHPRGGAGREAPA